MAAWQCRLVGLSSSWVTRQVRDRGWVAVHRGVHRMAGVPVSPGGELWAAILAISDIRGEPRARVLIEDGRQLVPAVLLAVQQVAAVTGWSAAWLLQTGRPPPAIPQLLVASHHQTRGRHIRCVRSTFAAEAVDHVLGVPCVQPERMLWDAAFIGRHGRRIEESLQDLAINLDRRRLLPVADVLGMVGEPAVFDLPSRVPGPLRRTAEILRPGFSHSHTEARARAVAMPIGDELGIHVEPRPLAITNDGRIIAEADIAVPELRWDVEIDGPHHRAVSMRRRDKRRDLRLGSINWSVTRYDCDLIDNDLAAYADLFRTELTARMCRQAA